MKELKELKKDFISYEERNFRWRIGRLLASSLTGFIAGIIISIIIFFSFFDISWKIDSIFLP